MSVQALSTLASTVGVILIVGTFLLYAARRSFGKPELVFCGFGALLIIVPIASRVNIKKGDTEIVIESLQNQVATIQSDVKQVAQVQGEIVEVQQEALKVVAEREPATAAPEPELDALLNELGRIRGKSAAINQQIQKRPIRVQPPER